MRYGTNIDLSYERDGPQPHHRESRSCALRRRRRKNIMNVWGILRTDEWLDPRLKQLQQQIKRESLEAFVGSADVSRCLWFRLQYVGVGYTVPRYMGNAYFCLGDGGGELERYCVKSIITCVWKAGSFVGSRPCPERIFQDLFVGVVGNNERGEPPRVRGTSWENTPAACRRDVHVRASARAFVDEKGRTSEPIWSDFWERSSLKFL